jgi:hypothetical protein
MEITAATRRALYDNDAHTKGEFSLDAEDKGLIVAEDSQFFAFVGRLFDSPPKTRVAEQHANAERIVVCLNACKEMPTSMLQTIGAVAAAYDVLRRVSRWVEHQRCFHES